MGLEYFIFYVEANLICILILLMILINDRIHRAQEEKQICFNRTIIAFILYFSSDIGWAAVLGGQLPRTRAFVVLFNLTNYVILSLITFEWFMFMAASEKMPFRKDRTKRMLWRLPMIVSILFLIISYALNPYFWINENGDLNSLYFPCMIAAPVLYVLTSFVFSIVNAIKTESEEDRKYYEEFRRVCRFREPGLVETEFIDELMFRVPMLQQLDAQSAFNKTFCYYWSYPGSTPDVGAAHSVELLFVFDLRSVGTNIPEEIFKAVQQTWTNFARCGNPSTDRIDWKAYSADEQNVLDIAGPGDIRIKKGLLADQYKAVLPLLGYYQFMDKYFTPGYLTGVIAEREQ